MKPNICFLTWQIIFKVLEDDGEFKLSIFAELYDAEIYTQTAIEKVEKHYDKLLIK